MEDKKTLNILRTASIVLLIMVPVAIIALWARNGFSPYLVYDKGRIADKVMLAAKLAVMLFILYKSTGDKKYFITFIAFAQAACIFWIRFMGNKVIDAEYMKIDRLSITICIMIALAAVFINIYEYPKGNRDFIWIALSSFGFMGVALSFDLVWMDFFLALAFLGLYMWIKDGKYIMLGAGIAAEIFVSVAAIFAAHYIEVTSLQSVIVNGAMGTEGSFYPKFMMIMAASLFLLCGIWLFIKKDSCISVRLYVASVVMVTAGIYLYIRFIPIYRGDIIGTVLKFGAAVALLLLAVYFNMVKQWKKSVMVLSLACPVGMLALLSAGWVITVLYGVIMFLIYVPLIITLYLNEDSGRYMYVHIVSVFCLILVPVQVVSYLMSAFKLYIEKENKAWLAIMGVSYVVLAAGLMRWLNRYGKDADDSPAQPEINRSAGRNILCASVIILAAVIAFMPAAIKDWIYPMMSQNEVMVSNLSSDKVPAMQIAVTAVMSAVTFVVPVLAKRIFYKIKSK